MLLSELISQIRKSRKKILQEHKILQDYQLQNPWVVTSVLDQMKEEGLKDIPSFDEVVALKEDFLLDDLSKVYHQIKKKNPLLINRGQSEKVYFYTIKPGLYNSQKKKGLSFGDKDNQGRLVTGSDIVIDTAAIEVKEFLDMYYSRYN